MNELKMLYDPTQYYETMRTAKQENRCGRCSSFYSERVLRKLSVLCPRASDSLDVAAEKRSAASFLRIFCFC